MTAGTESDQPRRVFLTGMFDMKNFGDLLFPLVAREALARFAIETVAVSPSGAAIDFEDAERSISFREFLEAGASGNGVLIGGGYIIHCHPMYFLENYAAEGLTDLAGPALWLGATLAASMHDIPIAWNAPGVPHPLPKGRHALIQAALRAADYLSLRDTGSLELIAAPQDLPVKIVPDPIAGIARVCDRKSLDAPFRRFLERKGCARDAQLCAVHARDRSLAGLGAAGLAALIDTFCANQGLTPVLVAVGQAHDDDRTAREIASCMSGPHVMLDDPSSLREIAAVLANSRLYAGSSLHGYIVAAAYDVPGVLIAKPSYRKFSGFLDHTGRAEDLAHDWAPGFALAAQRLREHVPMIPPSVHDALHSHWRTIASELSQPERGRARRNDFLRVWFKEGLQAGNLAWANLPFARPRVLNGKE